MLFTDQLGNTIHLDSFPKRIISLVPSQSELLWDLGLRDELCGITKFCVHPKFMYDTINRVGGTKTLNLDLIKSLKPDLIIGNKEENEQLQIKELQKYYPVWMSDIVNLKDSLKMIELLGDLTNTVEKAKQIKNGIESSFLSLKQKPKSVLYLIWKNPYMAAGKATFIGDMLAKMGLVNVVKDPTGRYPEITLEEIKTLKPDYIFLSSEPFPFNENHSIDFKKELPNSKPMVVDGELFSWYGSRLLKSAEYFNSLIDSYL